MKYETTYVIVAGVAWIRRSRVETSDGRIEDTLWAVTFGDGSATVRRGPAGDSTIERGELDGLSWELRRRSLAAPFETPHRALRPITPTRLVTWPAILVSGRLGDRELVDAPGHTATLTGRQHARTWGWAHVSSGDGRYVHLLTVVPPPLPRLSQYATEGRGPGLPIARGVVDETRVSVGPYVVDARPETFVGLEYLDTDGSSVWCYHSEAGHLRGNDVDLQGVAMEIASRERIPGWRVAP